MRRKLLFTFMCVVALQCLYGQRKISGSVTTTTGEPLPGASVLIKNTNQGTLTDETGVFTITLPAGNQVLVVSFIGYVSREVEVATSTSKIDISLEEGVTLNETVVTALGITRSEKSLGYAIAQVEGADLIKVRDINVVNQLAGRAAGVTVIGSTGNFGSSARITIRGIKSISGNNEPLFVVDGVPMDNSNFTPKYQPVGGYDTPDDSQFDYGNAIQDINPNDIENISVLKGQAAAALYGSRGANGVIMITTKKGQKTQKGIGVSINSSLTFESVLELPKYQNTYGGGVDLLPRGYSDNSGFYKTPYVEFGADGDTVGVFSSFDLVPIYAVDESSGTRFATTTDQHFQHLADQTVGDNGQAQYLFYNGFGQNQSNLNFRDWNSWDSWDTEHYGKSRVWEHGDYPGDFFKTGVTSSQNIALSGGGDHSTFRLSYNRLDQTGIYPNSHMERNSLGFNGSLDVNSQLSANIGANYINTRTLGRSGTGYDGGGGKNPAQNFSQWWHTELRFADLKSYENPDGSMRTWNRQSADNPSPQYWNNPYWERYKNPQRDGRDRYFGHVGLNWKINSWLSLAGRVLTDYYNDFREEKVAVGSISTPKFSLDLHTVGETNTDLILRADKNLSDDLTLNAFVGGNKLWRTIRRNLSYTRGGLNVPNIYTIQNSVDRPYIQTTISKKQINSLFGGASFGWRSMLYLDLTGRQDWSSALPDGSNGYFYPSASLSYVFSESWKMPFLSFGKIRLSWAKVGNDTDPYAIYTTYESDDNFGSHPNYTVPDKLNNPGLKPEETSTIEAGLDLRFLKDRIGLDLTLYSGKTTNQIIPLGTTPTTGFKEQLINAGEISNKGIEIGLNLTPVRTRNFNWDVRFNFGKNINKLVELNAADPSLTNIPITDFPFAVSFNAYEGRPYGTILGTNYLYDSNGNKLVDPNSGFYMVSSDVMPIGNTLPDFTGGLTNTITWKGLSISAFVDFRKGGDIFSLTNLWGKYSGLLAETAEGGIRENGVVNPGTVAELDAEGLPILVSGGNTETKLDDVYKTTGDKNTQSVNSQAHFFFDGGYIINKADVYDGSFIKLREVSIGYTLPKSLLKDLHIEDVQISLVGRNLAILFKNIPHVDPDNAVSTSNVQGSEAGAAPSVRSIGVNLSLKF